MCTGVEPYLLAAAIGLSAGGSYMQSQAQQKNAEERADARNAALANFQDKNQELSEEARAALEERLAQEEQTPQEAMGSLQEKRAEGAREVLDRSAVSAPIPLAGNAPQVVANEAAEAQQQTADKAGERSDALATARAFGDLLFDKGLATQDAGRDIGMVNTFARSNRRLLPVQQDLAEQSKMGVGSSMGTLGNVLQAAGSAASTAAGAGAFGGGGSGAQALSNAPHLGVPGTFGASAPKFAPIPRPRPVNLGL